jgi:hypothetical protein
MQYFLEISKIIDGGMLSDRQKVAAYAEQLAKKVEQDGDASVAKRIRECLSRRSSSETAANDLGSPTRLPVDGESRFRLADEIFPVDPPPFVVMPPVIQERVEQFVRYVEQADKLIAHGVGISPSMLLYGPPGCGKTALAVHIASRLNLPLLVARSDSLISSYLGSTAKNLRVLFEHAMSRPSVLFLDEFDAFAKVRDDQRELGELKRVVVSLLQNIDALDGRTILLAASNHEHLLDSAVWRRFSYKMNVGLPAPEERKAMFGKFLREFVPDDSLNLFVSASVSLSGSQIRYLCDDAARDSVLSGAAVADINSILRGIVSLRLPTPSHEIEEYVKQIHELDSVVFNGKRLASMFNKSTPTISRWLRG